jgi:flagellar hook protein FlgE
MTRAFISALGAMKANQNWMDVIGNNLANSNTLGFKASRATFSDQLSTTLRAASGPNANSGGRNPLQIGMGSVMSSVDHNFTQGALTSTGRTFDLAMSGRGFFALEGQGRTLYTRVGTFALDAARNMVDLRTGLRVLGANSNPVVVDTESAFPPKPSSAVEFAGNLPSEVTGPLSEELISSAPFKAGTPATLNSTVGGPYAVPVGETWTMELKMNGGSTQEVAVTSTTGSISAADVAAAIDSLDHVSATLAGGLVSVTSSVKGNNSSIKITPGEAGKDLAGLVGMSTSLVKGTETAALGTTDLNQLTSNTDTYAAGDTVEFSGTDADGTALAASFVYGTDGTTVDDLVAFLDGQYSGASVSYNASNQLLELTADDTGEASLSMVLLDGENQAGAADWTKHVMTLATNGAGPDQVTTSAEVFDQSGTAHQLTFDYTRQADGSWNMEVSMPPDEGTVLSGSITGMVFNPNGSILSPAAGNISVQFAGQSAQSLNLDFGGPGGFAGLTQFGGGGDVVVKSQDGYGAGTLGTMQVLGSGEIQGFYTNGETRSLGFFGVGTFSNELGLEEVGDSLWGQTANSGDLVYGSAQNGMAGDVVAGALEESNVDTAEEFVRLIQAQRGFQSNARVITTQDEMMSEANNMI